MPIHSSFEYAVLRVVPRVEREEFVNVGVILFCRQLSFIGSRAHLDEWRLAALAPGIDVVGLRRQLDVISSIVSGEPRAGALGALPPPERFRWLTAPRSTMLQVSPVHCGICVDPQSTLDDLFHNMVS